MFMLTENAERRYQLEMLWSYLVVATFVNRRWYYLVSFDKGMEGSHGKGWLGSQSYIGAPTVHDLLERQHG